MVFMDIGHQQYNTNTILKITSLNWFFSAGSVPLLQELTSQGTEKLMKITELQKFSSPLKIKIYTEN